MTDDAHLPDHTRARRTGVRLGIAALALALGAVALSSAIAKPKTEAKILAPGQSLVTVMDCTGCHTPGSLAGQRISIASSGAPTSGSPSDPTRAPAWSTRRT